jgi:EAL domain-containing protein (putative c-di-GMP-specific phosphodiesterase class I)
MTDFDNAVACLNKLRALGISLAIDDFGTGYSSLAYLSRLPVQVLKIDQAFVRNLGNDPSDTAIVVATLAIAKSLGLTVVAEGVELPAQRDFLIAHGCDDLQGYLFGKPAAADTFFVNA